MAKAGAAVALVSRSGQEIASLADEIELLGERTQAIVADAADRTQVVGMVQEVLGTFKRVDVLVNSAGAAWRLPLEETTADIWGETLAVNTPNVKGAAPGPPVHTDRDDQVFSRPSR